MKMPTAKEIKPPTIKNTWYKFSNKYVKMPVFTITSHITISISDIINMKYDLITRSCKKSDD